jgi:4-hydroxybenzoyl-CoA thioesterase
MLINTRRLTIEWGDCDPAGIVFYPRYFAMFDASTAALFARASGMTKKAMLRHYDVVGFPMVDTRATFRVPCAFGDEVTIESSVTEFRRASFDVRHRLLRDDGTEAVEGFETRVWVGRHPDKPDGIKALPIPEDLIARFRDPPGAP